MKIPGLKNAFKTTPTQTVSSAYGPGIFEQHALGVVTLDSGVVVVSDVLGSDQLQPYTQHVQSGQYPVRLSLFSFQDDSSHRRVAFSKIEFDAVEPTEWQMALTAGQDVSKLPSGAVYTFPVTTGTACYLDLETAKYLLQSPDVRKRVDNELLQQCDAHQLAGWTWAFVELAPKRNLISFSTGMGDGKYASYFGFAPPKKDPVCLVTDFVLFPDDPD